MKKHKLGLHRETLAPLVREALDRVVGGELASIGKPTWLPIHTCLPTSPATTCYPR